MATENQQSVVHLVLLTEPLDVQVIEGNVQVQFRGQSLNPEALATWAIGLWVVSPDGQETAGELLPFSTGGKDLFSAQSLELRVLKFALRTLRRSGR